MRHRTKFYADRSNTVVKIWPFSIFFQNSGRPPYQFCAIPDHPRRVFGGLRHCAKFGSIRCSSFDNIGLSSNIVRVWLENA